MVSHDRISRLAQQIGDRLQGASQAPEEVQKGIQQVVKGAFDRLELVSREDFDILMDVLQRTRSRVEALEQQVAALEEALDTAPSRETASASVEALPEEPGAASSHESNPEPGPKAGSDDSRPEEDADAGESNR
ncbi:accessory factor UbiK family protein [Halomonas urmiana]|uniref:Ubiquinone biosynthesis accessory factor UbiK n=1 Tax=Halomonas urmiana TaxID=490901 RepID=A0A5R8MMW3_9GAMM|nr:accessory factor UbiK family protein [Halomonas urmiana]TLF53760.1 accessory factor UbiK family protein [Halomonas urmiana]